MTTLASLLQNRAAEALGWTLVHFLWQGTVLAVVAFAVMRWLASTASTRYLVGIITLAVMAAAPVITVGALLRSSASTTGIFDPVATGHVSGGVAPSLPLMSAMLGLWMLGVAVLSIRLLGGWMLTRRLVTRAVEPAAAEISAIATRISRQLALRRLARIVHSSAVSVPVVIGWIKPVVLLPAAALSGLTLEQVEALLAHELAHVRRHDYLINILQSVVETLLFYHPAVWLLSKRIRIEREHCCDDLAVSVCDRVVYVSALTDLATLRLTAAPKLALAATDGPLLMRVRRLLATPSHAPHTPGWIAIGALLLAVVGMTPLVIAARQNRPADQGAQTGASSLPEGTVTTVERIVTPSPTVDELRHFAAQLERAAVEREALDRQHDPKRLAEQLERARLQLKTLEARQLYSKLLAEREAQSLSTRAMERQSDAKKAAEASNNAFAVDIEAEAPRTAAQAPPPVASEKPKAPRLLRAVRPEDTAEGKDNGIEGSVMLTAMILTDGTVGTISVVKGLGFGLDEAAMVAARQWTFEPATQDGKAVDYQAAIEMTFKLK